MEKNRTNSGSSLLYTGTGVRWIPYRNYFEAGGIRSYPIKGFGRIRAGGMRATHGSFQTNFSADFIVSEGKNRG